MITALGPVVYATTPADLLTDDLKKVCQIWMDSSEPGFSTASYGAYFGLNQLFEIKNDQARTGKELLMLSFVTEAKPSVFIEDIVSSIFTDHAERLNLEFTMFKEVREGEGDDALGAGKVDLEKVRKFLQERVTIFLNAIKADIDRSLEIQEKIDFMKGPEKKL